MQKQTKGSLIAESHPAPASFGFTACVFSPPLICVHHLSSKLCPQLSRACLCVVKQQLLLIKASDSICMVPACECGGKSFVLAAQYQAGGGSSKCHLAYLHQMQSWRSRLQVL